MRKRFIVDLTHEEQASLAGLLRKGVAPARKLTPCSAGNASTAVCRIVIASRGRSRLGKGGAIASV